MLMHIAINGSLHQTDFARKGLYAAGRGAMPTVRSFSSNGHRKIVFAVAGPYASSFVLK
jgi:hypothetical protein